MNGPVRFERLAHFLVVPVRLGGRIDSRFIFDSGIGVNLLDRRLAEELGVVTDGRVHTGRRMSGQPVETRLGQLDRLELSDRSWSNVTVAPLDLRTLSPALASVGGFLSLGLFERSALRIDYRAGTVEPLAASDGEEARSASEVPLRVERDGPAVSGFVRLRLPDGRDAEVEVDTGSDDLILHERYFDALVPDPGSARTVRGTDETGHEFVRRFAPLSGPVRLAEAPSIAHEDPRAIFQRIIYDGLVGDAFLRQFTVTFDPGRGRLGFDPPLSAAR